MRARLAWVLLLAASCKGPLLHVGSSESGLRDRLGQLAEGPLPAARLLLVSVAGLEPGSWAAAPGVPSAMPTIARLADLGTLAERMHVEAPPSAYPVHATLVTGRTPAKHGIVADQRLGDRGVRSERYSHASLIHGTTLWQLAEQRRVPAAAIDWPSTAGARMDQLLPDVGPLRRGERYADLLEGSATPIVAARLREAGDAVDAAAEPGAARDKLFVDLACSLIHGGRPPALLLLRLTQTEEALRTNGPGTPQARAAFASADAELARLLACYESAGLLADAAIAVVGDRTFEPVHTLVRPNTVLAQAALLELQQDGSEKEWTAIARSNGGSAFVYAKDETRAIEARHALELTARKTGAFRIVPAAEMLQLGADPEAWFGLDAEPGFGFSNAADGTLEAPSRARGQSGRLRTEGPGPAFVVFGRGFRRGVRVPEMSQLDVAPTLAAALGLSLGDAEGRALVGLLSGPAPSR